MAIDFAAKNVEINGGSVYIYKIPDSVVTDPTTYAAPNTVTAVASWSPSSPTALSYVSLGATDGNSLEITIDTLDVMCDQSASAILTPMVATGAVLTCTLEESLMWRLGIALGLDFSDSADITTASVYSPLLGASATRNVGYFGDFRATTFFDVVFEKYRTADKTKILGWRMPKAQVTEGPSFAYKHGETDFYEIKFKALSFDFSSSAAYYNECIIPYNDTV